MDLRPFIKLLGFINRPYVSSRFHVMLVAEKVLQLYGAVTFYYEFPRYSCVIVGMHICILTITFKKQLI